MLDAPKSIQEIRKGNVLQPTQRGFTLQAWDDYWSGIGSNLTGREHEIHLAGHVFFQLLSEIRDKIAKLYERYPSAAPEELVKLYLALSNRDRAILERRSSQGVDAITNTFDAHIFIRSTDSNLSAQEVADGCVDGIERALKSATSIISGKTALAASDRPLDILSFVSQEAVLSQLYGIYESYWHALIWGDYRFNALDESGRAFILRQEKSPLEVAAICGQIRRQKLVSHLMPAAFFPEIKRLHDDDLFLAIKGSGKKKQFVASKISKASEEVRGMHSFLRIYTDLVFDEIPKSLVEERTRNGFSLAEALAVFKSLVVLAHQCSMKYPVNTEGNSQSKLLQFCPRAKISRLASGLSAVLGFSNEHIRSILKFLEYRGEKHQDLWCNPILRVSPSEYALLTSALVTPALVRVLERWIWQSGLDMADKGLSYERLVADSCRESLRQNTILDDYDCAAALIIKGNNSEEEVDLLIRVGQTVLVVEVKSIVTTDSPISQYRTLERLEGAAEQVKRKAKFVEANLVSVFRYAGWEYFSDKEYTILGCIVNSGRIFVGTSILGIPIVDEHVLKQYLSSCEVPLFSEMSAETGSDTSLAWFRLYGDSQTMQRNLQTYLREPPHLNPAQFEIKLETSFVPKVSQDSIAIYYCRLMARRRNIKEIVEIDCQFPLERIDDFDERLAEFDALA